VLLNIIRLEHEGPDGIVSQGQTDTEQREQKIRNQSTSENSRNIGEVGEVGIGSEVKIRMDFTLTTSWILLYYVLFTLPFGSCSSMLCIYCGSICSTTLLCIGESRHFIRDLNEVCTQERVDSCQLYCSVTK